MTNTEKKISRIVGTSFIDISDIYSFWDRVADIDI